MEWQWNGNGMAMEWQCNGRKYALLEILERLFAGASYASCRRTTGTPRLLRLPRKRSVYLWGVFAPAIRNTTREGRRSQNNPKSSLFRRKPFHIFSPPSEFLDHLIQFLHQCESKTRCENKVRCQIESNSGLWWKIKALRRHFFDFYECLPRSQEASSRLRGFVSLVFQPVLLLDFCHTIPNVCILSPWCLLQTLDLEQSREVQTMSQAHLCGLCLQAFSGRAQQLLTERMTQHLAKRKACQSRSWRHVTRDHRLDATSANDSSRTVLLMFFFSLVESLESSSLLDCSALEDLRGTRCKKEFSYSYSSFRDVK